MGHARYSSAHITTSIVFLLPQQNRDMGAEGAGGQGRGPTKEVTFGPEGPIGKVEMKGKDAGPGLVSTLSWQHCDGLQALRAPGRSHVTHGPGA